MHDRTADRLYLNPDHDRDVRRSEPDALFADAEHRAAHLARRLHDAWLEGAGHETLASLAGAIVVVGRAHGAKLRYSDLLTEKEVDKLTLTMRAVVLRAEAVGRGSERDRRRALRRLAEAAAGVGFL
ncbi:MAG: hypothetical protein EKK55_14710 [Rhodocyclaceae bacterium]|nr:MAG: hypothetical protein EKK55_14710 [Rhodocyclaceae bacterium]